MGGVVSKQYTMATTHIVAHTVLSEKCAKAYENHRPVMTADWVRAIWRESLNDAAHATDSKFTAMECPIFYNLRFCTSQIPTRVKDSIKQIVEANGKSSII